MSGAPIPYRRLPGAAHRRPQPDANVVRRHWRDLASAALAIARSVEASEGREVSVRLEFRHDLARAPAFPMPGSDLAVGAVLRCFRDSCEALLAARTADRVALLAPLVEASAKAVDALLDEEIAPYVAHARRITGETEFDA